MSKKKNSDRNFSRALASGFVALGMAFAVLLTSSFTTGAYAADGGKVFKRKCAMCHSLEEGKKRIGPSLYGLFYREAGTLDKFRYSKAIRESGIVWDESTIRTFLENPRKFIPGTKMMFRGFKKQEDLDALVTYLMDTLKIKAAK